MTGFAQCLRDLVKIRCPEAKKFAPAMDDNLSMRKPVSLYRTSRTEIMASPENVDA